MTQQQKTEIQTLLKSYIEQYSSQSKAVASLKGVSEATVIQLLKSRWDSISDEMFTSIGKQVGYDTKGAWHLVKTKGFNTLTTYLSDAKEYSNVFALIANEGGGKKAASEWYAARNENVFIVSCSEYFNKKVFLSKMLEAMGKISNGYNVAEMMDTIVEHLLRLKEPLFVFDEFDKLKDEIFLFFITLYNRLEDKCGIVIMGTEYLSRRIRTGNRLNRRGYAEIFSRLGRAFIQIPRASRKEIAEICESNGCDNQEEISDIFNTCDGDLRRVKRAVHKYKLMQARKVA